MANLKIQEIREEENMSAKVAYDEYKKNKVVTASGVELIVQLYDEVIKNAQRARAILKKSEKLTFDEIKEKTRSINKAVNIVTGLADALDMEKGGEISLHLSKLYEFVNMRLLSANVNGDPVMLDESLRILCELREGWIGILKQETECRHTVNSRQRENPEPELPQGAVPVRKYEMYNRQAIKL
jgi:flagellar protein FliS